MRNENHPRQRGCKSQDKKVQKRENKDVQKKHYFLEELEKNSSFSFNLYDSPLIDITCE